MPISEKIIEKIKKSPHSDSFKKLILLILENEDRGISHYKDEYCKLINDYIDNTCDEKRVSSDD